MSRRVLLLVPGLLLAGIILVTSALPTEAKHALHTQGMLHLWLHLFGFALLSFFLLSATRALPLQALLFALLLIFGYATEAHESHANGWPVEQADVRTDFSGVLLGAVAAVSVGRVLANMASKP